MKQRKSKETKLPRHFTTIEDLPVYNWWKVEEENNLKWLLKFPRELKDIETMLLHVVWKKITDEFTEVFGISDKYRRIMEIRASIAVCEIDYALTKDEFIKNDIKFLENELKAESVVKNKGDNTKAAIYASRFMHQMIDIRKTSVKEFYTILETMKEHEEIERKTRKKQQVF